MVHANLSHRRTHNILLISRLLNQREGASPFTLLLDTLEQPAHPLLREYVRRAQVISLILIRAVHFLTLSAFEEPHNLPLFPETTCSAGYRYLHSMLEQVA